MQPPESLRGLAPVPDVPAAPSADRPTVIVLASGRGERFRASGGTLHKLDAPIGGRPVRERTLDAVRASGADAYVTADLRHHPASEAREAAQRGGSPNVVVLDERGRPVDFINVERLSRWRTAVVFDDVLPGKDLVSG